MSIRTRRITSRRRCCSRRSRSTRRPTRLPDRAARPRLAERVAEVVAAFDLGSPGRLSAGPVAAGRMGAIWRLDTDRGSWAVKEVGDVAAATLTEIREGAAFQEAAGASGVPTPRVRRSREGDVIADAGGIHVRVHGWAELEDATVDLDAVAVGRLVAGLHRVAFTGSVGVDPWYSQPVTAVRWAAAVDALRDGDAPFAEELASMVPEIVVLGSYVSAEPRSLRTCHRDLWADNVRQTRTGSLCVFDFDNAGLADPSQELAGVLIEYAGSDARRAAAIRDAYAEAGGPGRVEGRTDFGMAIAQLTHILEEGCRRWLASTTDVDRADNEGWVREYLDRPITRSLIETLLSA